MSHLDNQPSSASAVATPAIAPSQAQLDPPPAPQAQSQEEASSATSVASASEASSQAQAPSQTTQAHAPTTTHGQPVPPSKHVFQLILEQFWGDGVSKREIRSVYTSASDANAACHDYLLRTWPRDQFSLYELGESPQRPELAKVSAQIHGDRFHVWIERHSWEGILDFSSHAIARRTGKGPNAYILQRTIKDASGGKRRSTTRGIYATRQLAKQALAADEPPAEWSSNQGYVLEPGGEYAHAMSPSGKTAWLFIEVRPLFMSYRRMEEEQEAISGTSAQHPISLDQGDDHTSAPASPSTLHGITNPFSPMHSNPDEAGAFVYLVLQLKTLPYTPPILTVEAVTYELEVANRLGIALLEGFNRPTHLTEPVFREDGCLQGTVEQPRRDEGLSVWVEKRVVVLGDEPLEYDLQSEHGSVASTPRMQSLLSNTYNETVGGTKEKIGRTVGNEHLAGTGASQKAQAQANQQRIDAETHAKGLGHQAEGKAQKVVGGTTNDHSMEARGHGNSALGDVQRNV
ncbi:hypothetical protein BGZ82_001283 [Podila clonocystis]|nr:hypothetical protein BGZ82_001283 [Podila clonocystis]